MEKENKSLGQKVFRDILWSSSASIITRIGGLIFTIILARFLLPEGFGLYSLATSIALVFLTFADLGINQTMMRFVSSEIEKKEKKAAAYFRYALKLKVILSLIISIILLAIAYPLSFYIFKKPEIFILLIILSFYVFILALESFFESLFYTRSKIKYITIKEIILQLSRILIAALVFFFVVKTYHLLGVIITLLLTAAVVFIFMLYYSKKIFSFILEKPEIEIDKKRVIRFISYLSLGSLLGVLLGSIDVIMLGIFVSSKYIGYYRSAFMLVSGIAGLFSFLNVFLPVLTKIKRKNLQTAFGKIMKYSLILSIPSAIGIAFLSSYVLRTIYGYEYLAASLSLYILTPLIVLFIFVSNLSILFSAREKPRQFTKLTLFITILNLIFVYSAITFFLRYSESAAIAGVALATLASWIVYSIGATILAKKKLKISIDTKTIIKPLFASLIMALFLYLFNKLIQDMSLANGFIEVVMGAVIYFAVLLAIGGIKFEEVFALIFKKHEK